MITTLLKEKKMTLISYLQGYKNIRVNNLKPRYVNKSGNLILIVKKPQAKETILKIAYSSVAITRLKKESFFYTEIYRKHFKNCFKIPTLNESHFGNNYNYIEMEKLPVTKVLGNAHFLNSEIEFSIFKKIIESLNCMHNNTPDNLKNFELKRSFTYYSKLLKRSYFRKPDVKDLILRYLETYRIIADKNYSNRAFVLKDVNFGNIIKNNESKLLMLIDFSSYGKGFAPIDYSYLYTVLLQSQNFQLRQRDLFTNEIIRVIKNPEMQFIFWFDVLVRILEENEYWQNADSSELTNLPKKTLSYYQQELKRIEFILNKY